MKLDNIHFNSDFLAGYKKTFNIIQSCRSSGKSIDLSKRVYKAFKRDKRPSIVLRRQIADLTEAYIDDFVKGINKFLDDDKQIQVFYKSSNLTAGIVDVYTSLKDLKNKTNPFLRFIALSTKKQRLKSGILRRVKYILFDEFMIDVRNKEKYLPNEVNSFLELYSTYCRESDDLTCWFLGNAYSYFSPYHAHFGIDPNKISMGCVITTNNAVFNLFKPSQELIDIILKENKALGLDDDFEKYALYGVPVNDQNVVITKAQPRNFKLCYIFRVNGHDLGVFRNTGVNRKVKFKYWIKDIKNWNTNNSRPIFTFNLDDVSDSVYIPVPEILSIFMPLKRALMLHDVAYENVNNAYYLESLYNSLPIV